ncbi:MAG: N-acetylglucosamine kinase [Microcoleaceae cyanobacterium]
MNYVLGLDGGGTKTVCVLMDETGRVLSRGESGPANYQTVGLEVVRQSLEVAIAQAIAQSGYSKVAIRGMSLGLAGVGRPEDFQAIQSVIQQLQSLSELPVQWNLQPEALLIGSDHLSALIGGLGHGVGIVAIAGTGSHVFGQNSRGQTKRVGGWGYLLGDEGSGYDIAIQGLRAALRFYDGRGEFTQLVEAFQVHLELDSPEALIELIYRQGWGVKDIAALALIVDRVAVTGDKIAQDIILTAAQELALATQVVIHALFDPMADLEVVTQGGTWQGLANLRQHFEARVRETAPRVQVVWPRHEPAYGAGILALQALGFKYF